MRYIAKSKVAVIHINSKYAINRYEKKYKLYK